jgi:hypothetical protein
MSAEAPFDAHSKAAFRQENVVVQSTRLADTGHRGTAGLALRAVPEWRRQSVLNSLLKSGRRLPPFGLRNDRLKIR